MNQTKMKVGMIGVGNFGAARRQRMRETNLFTIVACHDRNANALAQALEQDGAKSCASVDELLATPGLEGLVISTGIDSHVDLAVRGMDAGLHIFVEKPLCGKIEEIQIIRDAQHRTRKIVVVGHNDNASDRIVRLIHEYLNNGLLGTLVSYEANTSHSGGLSIKAGDWRSHRKLNPGGNLMQCGVHALHRLIHLFGPIEQLVAMMRYDVHTESQSADATNVLVRHGNGLLGTLNCYYVTAYNHELRLFGTKGNLYIDTHELRAWFQPRLEGPAELRKEIPMPMPLPLEHCANLINWYKAAREDAAPSPSLEDGINAVLPVFAAELSEETNSIVTIQHLLEMNHV